MAFRKRGLCHKKTPGNPPSAEHEATATLCCSSSMKGVGTKEQHGHGKPGYQFLSNAEKEVLLTQQHLKLTSVFVNTKSLNKNEIK